MKRIKIIGCGNLLAQDEGVGIHITRRLRREILPESVEIKELRTPGQMLMELVGGAHKLIIIDACRGEVKIGEFFRRQGCGGGDIKKLFAGTLHAIHLHRLFTSEENTLSKKMPEEIVVFGIEIGNNQKFSVGLSNEVFASMDGVVDAVLQELY